MIDSLQSILSSIRRDEVGLGLFEGCFENVDYSVFLTNVDSMAVAFHGSELRRRSQLGTPTFSDLKAAGVRLADAVRYLDEELGVLESDKDSGIQIRSTKPEQIPGGCRYYELVLSTHGVSFERYEKRNSQERTKIDSVLTEKIFLRLFGDIYAALSSEHTPKRLSK